MDTQTVAPGQMTRHDGYAFGLTGDRDEGWANITAELTGRAEDSVAIRVYDMSGTTYPPLLVLYTMTWAELVAAWVYVGYGYLRDVGFNLVTATRIFRDPPREITFTARMTRYRLGSNREHAAIAEFLCDEWLDQAHDCARTGTRWRGRD